MMGGKERQEVQTSARTLLVEDRKELIMEAWNWSMCDDDANLDSEAVCKSGV